MSALLVLFCFLCCGRFVFEPVLIKLQSIGRGLIFFGLLGLLFEICRGNFSHDLVFYKKGFAVVLVLKAVDGS